MSWMKKIASSIWTDHKTEAFSCVIGFLVLVALVISSYVTNLDPSIAVQSFTLVVLVIVTIWYAKSTRDAARIATEAAHNAVAPIIKLSINREHLYVGCVPITYKNIGKGPAMNVVFWLDAEGEEFDYLRSGLEKRKTYLPAVGANETGDYIWPENIHASQPQPIPDVNLVLDVVAEYTDILDNKFESKLTIDGLRNKRFSYK